VFGVSGQQRQSAAVPPDPRPVPERSHGCLLLVRAAGTLLLLLLCSQCTSCTSLCAEPFRTNLLS
jgi:hypothetical protein